MRTVVSRVEATQLTDSAEPALHVLQAVRHQVEHPLTGPQVKHMAALQILGGEGETCIHLVGGREGRVRGEWVCEEGQCVCVVGVGVCYLFTQVQVDGADGLAGVVVFVVF